MAQRGRNISSDILKPRLLLCVSVLALVMLGLVMVYSSSFVEAINEGSDTEYYLIKQATYALVGMALAVAVYFMRPELVYTRQAMILIWVVSMGLLIYTAVFGIEDLGAKRWAAIGSFSFQPSEFVKIFLVLIAAWIYARYVEVGFELKTAILLVAVGILVPVFFLYKSQSDLGTTLIILVGIMAALWIGGVNRKVFALIVAVLIVFGLIAVFGTGYRASRLNTLNPWDDGNNGMGTGYQLIHSWFGFAGGGILGVGLGNGAEKYLYLPEAETDFIFAIIGEELGMVGALIVVALFGLVLYAGLQIARQAASLTSRLVAGSLTIMLVFQAFLNIGCVLGLLPTTGKPLPFISSGGSSLIASLVMVGIILAISRETEIDDQHTVSRDDLRVVRSTDSAPGPRPGFRAIRGNAMRANADIRGVESRLGAGRGQALPAEREDAYAIRR